MDLAKQYVIDAIKNAAKDLFETMIHLPLSSGEVHQDFSKIKKEITAMIGCAGENRGIMSLFLPERTAFKCVGAMLGMEVNEFDSCINDAVGEMANMIFGGAKTELYEKKINFNISTPTVIVGSEYSVYSGDTSNQTVILFNLGDDKFFISFCLKPTE